MFFFSSENLAQLPFHLSVLLKDYLEEERVYSADELSSLLEEYLKYLGWLWISDYCHATHHDPEIDNLLNQAIFSSKREPSVGFWAYIGSQFSQIYKKNQWVAFFAPLNRIQYGNPEDKESALSKLLHFRNHFAHGSFESMLKDILEHQEVFERFATPFMLHPQFPLLFWDVSSECWRNGFGNAEQIKLSGLAPTNNLCVMLNPQGEMLPLSPFLQVQKDKKQWFIRSLHISEKTQAEKEALFEHKEQTLQNIHDFQRKKNGFLTFFDSTALLQENEISSENMSKMQKQIKECFDKIQDRPSIVLLQSYPGGGKTHFISQAKQIFSGFDGYFLYKIQKEDVSSSALTFCNFVIREYSQQFQEPRWLNLLEEKGSLLAFHHLLKELQPLRRNIFIGIDDFHHAYKPYAGEEISIVQVFSQIEGVSGEALDILLTARHGYEDYLVYDIIVDLPIEKYAPKESYESCLSDVFLSEKDSVQHLSQEERYFRRQVLFLLANSQHPISLHDLCTALERMVEQKKKIPISLPVFTPQVERALWELRPLLRLTDSYTSETKNVFYQLYCPHFAKWIRNNHYF